MKILQEFEKRFTYLPQLTIYHQTILYLLKRLWRPSICRNMLSSTRLVSDNLLLSNLLIRIAGPLGDTGSIFAWMVLVLVSERSLPKDALCAWPCANFYLKAFLSLFAKSAAFFVSCCFFDFSFTQNSSNMRINLGSSISLGEIFLMTDLNSSKSSYAWISKPNFCIAVSYYI